MKQSKTALPSLLLCLISSIYYVPDVAAKNNPLNSDDYQSDLRAATISKISETNHPRLSSGTGKDTTLKNKLHQLISLSATSFAVFCNRKSHKDPNSWGLNPNFCALQSLIPAYGVFLLGEPD